MNKEDDDNKTCCELSSGSRTLALNGQECLYLEGIDPNGIVSLLQTRIPETIDTVYFFSQK